MNTCFTMIMKGVTYSSKYRDDRVNRYGNNVVFSNKLPISSTT